MANRLQILILYIFLNAGYATTCAQSVAGLPDSLQSPARIDTAYVHSLLDYAKSILYQDPTTSQQIFLHALDLSDSLDDITSKSEGLYGAGLAYSYLGQLSTANQWLDSAATLFLSLDDSLQYHHCIFMKGANYGNMGYYIQAMEANTQSLNYFRRVDNTDMVCRTTNNIGNLLYQQEKYRSAIDFYREAMLGGRETGNKILESVATANVAFCYSKMDSLAQGETYFQKVYDFNLENEVLFVHAQVCAEFAELKITMGDLNGARKLLEESIERATVIGDSAGIGNAWSVYGRLAVEEGEPEKAIAYLKDALGVAERFENPEMSIHVGEILSDVYWKQGDYERAFLAYRDQITLRDSLYAREKSQQLAEMTSILETERKQLELDQLKAEKRFQDQVVQQQKWFIGLLAVAFGVALVLLVIAVIGERRRRSANRSLAERNVFIADQKQEIQEKNTILEAQNQEIEGLIEVVAHDLKAPISKTMALLNLVDRNAIDEDSQSYLDMSDKVLQGSLELIRDILTVRNLEQEEGQIEKEAFDLLQMLKATAEPYHGTSAAKNIRLDLQLPSGPQMISSNAQAVQRVVENLLSNAIKFSPPGKTVVLSLNKSGSGWAISVVDEGPGISSQDQERMFRKFERLSATPTGGESSTGLGLAIAKALTERLGGRISVESQLGKGARFTLELPA